MVLVFVLLIFSLLEIPDALLVIQIMYVPTHRQPWHVSSCCVTTPHLTPSQNLSSVTNPSSSPFVLSPSLLSLPVQSSTAIFRASTQECHLPGAYHHWMSLCSLLPVAESSNGFGGKLLSLPPTPNSGSNIHVGLILLSVFTLLTLDFQECFQSWPDTN